MKIYVVPEHFEVGRIYMSRKEADKRAKLIGGYVEEHNTCDRCGRCHYSHIDELGDMYCCNYKSEYCTECISEHDSCEAWEGNQ